MELKVSDQPRLLNELIESLGQASGAASQLIYQQGGDPRWMMIRDALDLAKEGCVGIATIAATKITAVKPI